jgi:hypothetical protein
VAFGSLSDQCQNLPALPERRTATARASRRWPGSMAGSIVLPPHWVTLTCRQCRAP